MAKELVKVKWLENMAFSAEVSGHEIIIDANEKVGGQDRGARPKPLMLASLAGCTGMDVVSILKKMRVEIDDFNVLVEGELTEEHPKHFISMHVVYEFTGKNLPMEKIQKAVSLSEERYCGVTATYRKAMKLTSEIKIKEE
jgi:putative redox protein